MRIAITGATGFVGAHLTSRLESEGHELVLIARRSRNDDARFRISDLSDTEQLRELFTGCDAVAHCRCLTTLYQHAASRPTRSAAACQSLVPSASAISVSVLSHRRHKRHKTEF